MAAPDERFALYAQTIIEITLPDGSTVSSSPGRPPPSQLRDLLPLVVITAWNPADERPGPAANHAAHQELLALLDRRVRAGERIQVLNAVGRSPDGSHSEDSAAVRGLALEDAIALARQLRQDALFELTASGIEVVECQGSPGGSRPRFSGTAPIS